MKHTKCYIKNYPRPQFVRTDWINLNGNWKFGFDEEVDRKSALQGILPQTICVPFTYETVLSGINESKHHDVVWYSTTIHGKKEKHTLLHFEGSDYNTEVYVNGVFIGAHQGAYTRFSFDITDFLNDNENILTVKCTDFNSPEQIRGKQRWRDESFACWYVQTTGIYKTVWLEYVEETYLTNLKITPDIQNSRVQFDFSVNKPADDVEVRFSISFDGMHIQTVSCAANDVENSISAQFLNNRLTFKIATWNINAPNLYDIDIFVYKNGVLTDQVGSYFGLRDYQTNNGQILLNSAPFYAKLLLNQGYWKSSALTPPSEEALLEDIQFCQAMGFNGVRMHQKIEDERFYYYADILGFTVWCELPANYRFCDKATKNISKEWLDIVTQHYNHPSVVTWVIFNESWGVANIENNQAQQNLATGLYYLTKSIDPMRPVISNDGWLHTKSDILTLHHYSQDGEQLYAHYNSKERLISAPTGACLPFANGYHYEGQPIIISEFGGTAFVDDCNDTNWGYGAGAKDVKEFLDRFDSLFKAIEKMQINGYCYTQLSDVEQEVNGLLNHEHKPKFSLEEIKKRTSR